VAYVEETAKAGQRRGAATDVTGFTPVTAALDGKLPFASLAFFDGG